jgi:hypothetical protein
LGAESTNHNVIGQKHRREYAHNTNTSTTAFHKRVTSSDLNKELPQLRTAAHPEESINVGEHVGPHCIHEQLQLSQILQVAQLGQLGLEIFPGTQDRHDLQIFPSKK